MTVCNAVEGVAVPIPSLSLVLSQKKLELFWVRREPLEKMTEPLVKDVDPVPPLDTPTLVVVPKTPPEVLVTIPAVESPEKVTVELAARVVNDPVEAVVAPMAVELIPVEVVLKCPVVKLKSAPPEVARLEAVKPDRVKDPEVAVSDSAPVERVKPF